MTQSPTRDRLHSEVEIPRPMRRPEWIKSKSPYR